MSEGPSDEAPEIVAERVLAHATGCGYTPTEMIAAVIVAEREHAQRTAAEATRVGRACAEAARDALAWMERWNAPVEARRPLAAAVKEAQWMGWLK